MKMLLLVALVAASLGAQPAAEDRQALAKRLVQALQLVKAVEVSMAATQEAISANFMESMVRSNPSFDKMTADQRNAFVTAGNAMMKRLQSKIQTELSQAMNVGEEVALVLAPIYASYFSTDEMRKLIEFYETPLGRKVAGAAVAVQPEVTKKMQSDLLPRMMSVMERVVRDEQPAMTADMVKTMEEILARKP